MTPWQRFHALAGVACPRCGGSAWSEGYNPGKVCEDCQGSGWWAWELSEECQCRWLQDQKQEVIDRQHRSKGDCSGSGRVLKSGDSLLVAAEAVLERIWVHWWLEKLPDGRYVYGRNWDGLYEPASTRLTAAVLALETLVPKS